MCVRVFGGGAERRPSMHVILSPLCVYGARGGV